MNIKFKKLNKTIIKCKKCPRLIKFVKKISTEKRKQNISEKYWGKPLTGFGEFNSKLMILGLAPAAHGGTRTGRELLLEINQEIFYSNVYETGFANQPISKSLDDGLKIKSTYITNILKCVPPGDKPLNKELENCSIYLNSEIKNLEKLKIILTLGKLAFDNVLNFIRKIIRLMENLCSNMVKNITFQMANYYLALIIQAQEM